MTSIPPLYTIAQLSQIFKASSETTARILKSFKIPLETKERCTTKIDMNLILLYRPYLYQSIYLTINRDIKKPLFYVRDLCQYFNKKHKTMLRYLKKHNIPMHKVGNKFSILATTIPLIIQEKTNVR